MLKFCENFLEIIKFEKKMWKFCENFERNVIGKLKMLLRSLVKLKKRKQCMYLWPGGGGKRRMTELRLFWTQLSMTLSDCIWPSMRKFSWNFLNFSGNFLKFFQKLPSAYIFINCTNLSTFVEIIFDTHLNFIRLSNTSQTFCKISTKFQYVFCKIYTKFYP